MIVLIGFMGAGKTTVGKELASALGLAFADTDELIESRTGRSIPEIFASGGEQTFRALESEVVLDALGSDIGVLALGGGAITTPEVRAALAAHQVVYLDIGYESAQARISSDPHRPLAAAPDLRRHYAERTGLYERAADLTVPVTDATPSQIASQIIQSR
jgi:shikimate kinase